LWKENEAKEATTAKKADLTLSHLPARTMASQIIASLKNDPGRLRSKETSTLSKEGSWNANPRFQLPRVAPPSPAYPGLPIFGSSGVIP